MEMVDVVDTQDRILYTTSKREIVNKCLRHRSSVIYVFNSAGEIFVHQRVPEKEVYPNLYSMAVGGRISSGERPFVGATRETKEEIGAIDPLVTFLFKSSYDSDIDHAIAYVYKCTYDGPITIQRSEIAWGEFMPIQQLEKMIKEKEFCPDMLKFWREYRRLENQ